MKRLIKSSIDQNILGKWAYYFELENPAEWDVPDTNEILDEYVRLCSEYGGYEFIGLIDAKDPWHNYLGMLSELIAARTASGEIRLFDLLFKGRLYVEDVTDQVEQELSHLDEMQEYM